MLLTMGDPIELVSLACSVSEEIVGIAAELLLAGTAVEHVHT
jgi:hypothetical protein